MDSAIAAANTAEKKADAQMAATEKELNALNTKDVQQVDGWKSALNKAVNTNRAQEAPAMGAENEETDRQLESTSDSIQTALDATSAAKESYQANARQAIQQAQKSLDNVYAAQANDWKEALQQMTTETE